MKPWPTFSVNVKLWLLSDMYIWAPFLDPEDIKSLSLGAIWCFSKGIWYQIVGHKGPVFKA